MTFEIWWERYRMQGQSVLQRDLAKQAWDAAIAEEREACCKLIGDIYQPWWDSDDNGGYYAEICAAIRARSTP
jgi:hypothetical protein